MKNLILITSLLLIGLPSFADSSEVVFNKCIDGTFYYRTITAEITDEAVNLELSGSGIVNTGISAEVDISYALNKISIPKESCIISDTESRVMRCNISDITLLRSDTGREAGLEPINLKSLEFEISKYEAIGFNPQGLISGYQVSVTHLVKDSEGDYIETSARTRFPEHYLERCSVEAEDTVKD